LISTKRLSVFIFLVISVSFCLCIEAKDKKENLTALPNIRVVLFPFKRTAISSTVNSTVKDYKLKVGDTFSKGDVILQLDNTIYLQKYIVAEANSLFASKAYNNNVELAQKGGIGQYVLAKSQFEQKAAKAEMEIAKSELNACTIIAPFNGRLVKKITAEHEFVKIGQPIIELIDDYQLLAVMHLPSNQKISKGQEIKFKIDETSTIHSGKVYEIPGEIDHRSRTYEIKVLIDNKKRQLSTGMSAVVFTGP
jgi:membrane fusion protein, multidrug efflux system